MQPTDFTARLARDRLAAIVRGRCADAALRTVLTLVEEGVGLVEVSLNAGCAWLHVDFEDPPVLPGRVRVPGDGGGVAGAELAPGASSQPSQNTLLFAPAPA